MEEVFDMEMPQYYDLLGVEVSQEQYDYLMQEQANGKELKVYNGRVVAVKPIKYKLLGVEMPYEQFDYLICEQNKGKELKLIDGVVVAVDHEVTEKERLEIEMRELMAWFEEYDNQVKQYQRCVRLGILYDRDIDALDNQAHENQQRIAEIKQKLKSLGGA